MNVQTETFHGYGRQGQMSDRTAVECRFGGDVESVLAVHAEIFLSGAEVTEGEVRYEGRVRFTLVYEDGDRRICRAERGVEFAARAKGGACRPGQTARVYAYAENTSVRREGAGIYASAAIVAEISLYGDTKAEYVVGGDLVCRRERVACSVCRLCAGDLETDDLFETEAVADILLHSERVCVTRVAALHGALAVEGEVNLGILALRADNSLVSFERLIPFRAELPCEATPDCRGDARVNVKDATLRAESDEEDKKCRIFAECALHAEGYVWETVQLDAVSDAFSVTHEVKLSYAECSTEEVGERALITERVSGRAALSAPVDFSDSFQAVILQRAEAVRTADENGVRAEGAITATLLVQGADGARRGVELSLPFSLPLPVEGEVILSAMSCGMSARQRQEGSVDAEATLKLTVVPVHNGRVRWLAGVQEGECLPENDCAISIYVPRAGDGLWELARRLRKSPEEVCENNPDLEFPIREGQRVIVYRKKALSQAPDVKKS